MDSVPISFWEEIFSNDTLAWQFHEIENNFPEPWKTLAKKYASKRLHFNVSFPPGHGEWSCWMEILRGHDYKKTLDYILALGRRYVRCRSITIGEQIDPQFATEICRRKEDFTDKLLPLLIRKPPLNLAFWCQCPRETVVAYLDIFQHTFVFGSLDIPYCGQQSVDFLAAQLSNNPFLRILYLVSSIDPWPHTEVNEELVVQFLTSEKYVSEEERRVSIHSRVYEQDESALKVTLKMVKAAFDKWYQSEIRRVNVGGPVGVTMEEILSLPVPEDVERTEAVSMGSEGNASFVRFFRAEGSCLMCNFNEGLYFYVEGIHQKTQLPFNEADHYFDFEADSEWCSDGYYKEWPEPAHDDDRSDASS
uniref:Uncharacterized protein n=1 Tax=Steinernema glaseri TaxID=37863 RepID=A0A1I7ZTD0_9BILA